MAYRQALWIVSVRPPWKGELDVRKCTGVSDPGLAREPRSLHPGGEPLSAADTPSRRPSSAAAGGNMKTSTPPGSWCCRTCAWSSPSRRNYLGYGLPQADLIQEGNIGLMKAVRRFDPERGVRLVSFALHWIRAEIHEHVLRNWRLVKIATTKAQRKLFFNLRSMKRSSAALTPDEASSDRGRARRQARGSARDGDADLRRRRRARPDAGRRGHRCRRSPICGHRRRAGADPRARARRRAQSQRGPAHGDGEARRAQPPHHRSALAARGRRGDAAGARRRVRRIGRADPPDREQGAEDDALGRWRTLQ